MRKVRGCVWRGGVCKGVRLAQGDWECKETQRTVDRGKGRREFKEGFER